MIIYVGADWDRDKCVLQVQCGEEPSYGSEVKRNAQEVDAWVKALPEAQGVVVGIEAGDRYWTQLWEQAGAQVVIFDPNKAKRFSESLNSGGARDDRRSARALLVQVQSGAHREQANAPLPAELRGLDGLLRLHQTLSSDVQRFRNRLEEHLKQLHPAAWQALRSRLKSGYVLRLLQQAPTPQAWRELDEEAKQALFKGVSHAQRKRLREALGDEPVARLQSEELAARVQLSMLASQLEQSLKHEEQAKAHLDEAEQAFASCSIARSVKGMGRILGAGLTLAAASKGGQRERIATRTGVSPVTIRSGTKGDKKPLVRMRRNSLPLMRRIGYLIGVQLVARYAWAKAQYQHYRHKNINAAGAYRRVARSFTRIYHALVRDQTLFDEDQYVEALKRKGVRWALAL